ncbi:hypothetical protein GAMM_230008 [Gammaproteobacteria bacterium]
MVVALLNYCVMPGINAMISKLEAVSIADIVGIAMENTQKRLTDSQRNQLLEGLRSDGTKIGKYKSKTYAAKKFAMNPLAGLGNIDNRLTGAFQSDIIVDIRPESASLVFSSVDEKTSMLVSLQGKNIFGLSTPFAQEYSKYFLKPEVVKLIKQRINGV